MHTVGVPTNISSTFLDFSPDSLLLPLDVSKGMQHILSGFVMQCIKYQTILLADEGPPALGTWRSCSSRGSTLAGGYSIALWKGNHPFHLPHSDAAQPSQHSANLSSQLPHTSPGHWCWIRNQPDYLPVGEKTKRFECSENIFLCLTYPMLGGFV